MNLHIFSLGCEASGRMLRFGDWLRTNANDRQLYENEKRTLVARPWRHVEDYADPRSHLVRSILSRAAAVAV